LPDRNFNKNLNNSKKGPGKGQPDYSNTGKSHATWCIIRVVMWPL